VKSSRVVLIDDDRWFREQLARVLEGAAYHVSQAATGVEGMRVIDKARPDAIVVDLFMPGPNALVLLHELQSHSDLAPIPVIVCSNSADSLEGASFADYGVRRVFDKTTMHPADVVTALKKEGV
jgi:CheY-like chemotaxis protein